MPAAAGQQQTDHLGYQQRRQTTIEDALLSPKSIDLVTGMMGKKISALTRKLLQ